MLKRIRDLLSPRKKKPRAEAGPPRPPVSKGPKVVHHPIPRADLDPDAVKIVQRLTRFEHSAYLVGGCVRDLLLDRHPKDFDLATSATPRQVRRLFRNCRIIGRRFRLAHIYFQNGKIIEVATFRAHNGDELPSDQGEDKDLLIRVDNLFGTPEEDALRRDFTINSLFYDINNETVLDHADGLPDLRRKLVRTIGDPEVRFREDPIRILRAIKFAARLGFTVEPGTLKALKKTRNEIPKAAAPRILEEINRVCREGAGRRSFELLRETGVFEVILPEIRQRYTDDAAWRLLFAQLERLDHHRVGGGEVNTGQILTALLLPALSAKLGWDGKGKAEQPRGLDVRETIETVLRPIAQRLRLPRREQENCRQIVAMLFRMVPAGKLRPASKRSIRRRAGFGEAVLFLESLAAVYGGEFAEAFAEWKVGAPSSGQQPPADKPQAEQSASRSRRSRSRRGRGRDSKRAPEDRVKKTTAEPGKDLPAPWDDDYFFAALPTAPSSEGEKDGSTDRYGAKSLVTPAAAAEPASPEPSAAQEESQDDPKPRRRRRRSRRGRKSRGGKGQGEQPPPEGSSE